MKALCTTFPLIPFYSILMYLVTDQKSAFRKCDCWCTFNSYTLEHGVEDTELSLNQVWSWCPQSILYFTCHDWILTFSKLVTLLTCTYLDVTECLARYWPTNLSKTWDSFSRPFVKHFRWAFYNSFISYITMNPAQWPLSPFWSQWRVFAVNVFYWRRRLWKTRGMLSCLVLLGLHVFETEESASLPTIDVIEKWVFCKNHGRSCHHQILLEKWSVDFGRESCWIWWCELPMLFLEYSSLYALCEWSMSRNHVIFLPLRRFLNLNYRCIFVFPDGH